MPMNNGIWEYAEAEVIPATFSTFLNRLGDSVRAELLARAPLVVHSSIFSNVASVTIDNIFVDTRQIYDIEIGNLSSTVSAYLTMVFRKAGVDIAGLNYHYRRMAAIMTSNVIEDSAFGVSVANLPIFGHAHTNTVDTSNLRAVITRPAQIAATQIEATGVFAVGGGYHFQMGGRYSAAQSFDGLKITCPGLMTGTIRITARPA